MNEEVSGNRTVRGIKIHECPVINRVPARGEVSRHDPGVRTFQEPGNIVQVIPVENIRIFIPPERDIEFTVPVYPEEPVIAGPVEKNNLGRPVSPIQGYMHENRFPAIPY